MVGELEEETEKVNDVECYKLTGTLTGDDLMEIMEKQEKENGDSDSESLTAELESVVGEEYYLEDEEISADDEM